jgi:CRP-like cAMP-binding protein
LSNAIAHNIKSPEKWNTPDGHSPVASFAVQLAPLTPEAVKYIDEHTFKLSIKKGKHLLKSGEICNYTYLVMKGAVRGYIKEGAKEITTWITAEQSLITSIRGFHQNIASLENIQAIEDCELIGYHYDDLQYLYNNFIEMNIVGRILLEEYYAHAEERAYIARIPKAASKYEHFIATQGVLANRIKLKYIASFLGITIETLSRIRNKIRY